MLTVHFLSRKGLVVYGKLLQDIPCYFTPKRCSNKFQHCLETFQKTIWPEVPQLTWKPHTVSLVWRKCCFLRIHSAAICTSPYSLIGQRLDRKYVVVTMKPPVACCAPALLVCISIRLTPLGMDGSRWNCWKRRSNCICPSTVHHFMQNSASCYRSKVLAGFLKKNKSLFWNGTGTGQIWNQSRTVDSYVG